MSRDKADLSLILTLNRGSSSIKFAVYRTGDPPERRLHGKLDRLRDGGGTLTFNDEDGEHQIDLEREGEDAGYGSGPPTSDPQATGLQTDERRAVERFIEWLERKIHFSAVKAIGHRIVHGRDRSESQIVTPQLLADLRLLAPYAPEHLPQELALLEALGDRHPKVPQVACFDTAFHASLPRVARLLPLPRRFDALGIRRYGFHGLSYTYLLRELARVSGVKAAHGQVILAHLGNGASITAVHEGKSIDTSMGFTPAGGLPMGTRSGDLDPGTAAYLLTADLPDSGALTPAGLHHMVHHESGLLGISGISSDMRDLLPLQSQDVRAAEAVEVFCYQCRKWIGAFAAALGGLETLVFSGGVGENQSEIRSRVCHQLEFLGISLNETANQAHAPLISSASSRVAVHVIHTDEQAIIARDAIRLLHAESTPGAKHV